jgi:hypothetical protein
MGSSLDELKVAKKQINDLKKEVKNKIKTIFHSSVKDLFAENPNLKSISFNCYTPYFNDGDVCTFRSAHKYPDINGVGDYSDEEEDQKAWDELGKAEQNKITKAVKDFMSNWDNDDMFDLFGDHVKVNITAKKIEVEDYEHE